MTDFLARLAARVLNTAPLVEPVLTSRYAPGGVSALDGAWREAEAAPVRTAHPAMPLGLDAITRGVEPAARAGMLAPRDEDASAPTSWWREAEAAVSRRGPRSPEGLGLEEITAEVEPASRDTALARQDAFERSHADAHPLRPQSVLEPATGDDAGLWDDRDDGLLVPSGRAHAGPRGVDVEVSVEEDRFSAPDDSRNGRSRTSDASIRSAETIESTEAVGSIGSAGSTGLVESIETTELVESTGSAESITSTGSTRSAGSTGSADATRSSGSGGQAAAATGASSRRGRRSSVALGDDAMMEVHEGIVSSSRGSSSRESASRSASRSADETGVADSGAWRMLGAGDHLSGRGAARAGGAEADRGLLVPRHRSRARAHGDDAGAGDDAGPEAAPPASRGRRAAREEERGTNDAAPPTIKVSVGRVEIRALEPPARKRGAERGGDKAGAGWTAPVLSLASYLRPGGER